MQSMLLLKSAVGERQVIRHAKHGNVCEILGASVKFDYRLGAHLGIDTDNDVHYLAHAQPIRQRDVLQFGVYQRHVRGSTANSWQVAIGSISCVFEFYDSHFFRR